MKISKIILYNEPTVPEIQIEKIKQFITNTFQIKVEIQDNFFEDLEDKIFERIASTRIFDLKKQFKKHIPTQEEILIEKQNQDTSEQDIMILYDGFELQNIITENISIVDNTLHIIFTTGIIEAPAKPKQYYLDLMTDFSEDHARRY